MRNAIYSLTLAAAILWLGPVTSFSSGEAYAISPPPFVRGHLKCAINTNRFMKKLGRRQTHSPAALSFLKFPRVRHPIPGDVRVTFRKGRGKGHTKVYAGKGMCWNSSQSKARWVYGPCGPVGIYVRP